MERPLDDFNEVERPNTNYKKWSFRMLIYTLVINLAITYLIATSAEVLSTNSLNLRIGLLGLLAAFSFLAGIILTVLSYVNKEERNYQFHLSLWGFLLLIVLTILTSL